MKPRSAKATKRKSLKPPKKAKAIPTVRYVEKWQPREEGVVDRHVPAGYDANFHPKSFAKLVALGLNMDECARYFDILKHTLETWCKKYPEMGMVLNTTRINQDAEVLAALYKRATGFSVTSEKIFCTAEGDIVRVAYDNYYPPEVSAATFWLRTRHPELWNKAFGSNEDPTGRNAPPAVIQMVIAPARAGEDRSYRLGYDEPATIEGKPDAERD